MFFLRREARERTTPIGVIHRAVTRWGDAERTLRATASSGGSTASRTSTSRHGPSRSTGPRHNEPALAADGPLWVVLGDSTAQGLGASSPLHGYVGQVLAA